ncbi:MAG: hypothetical protein KDB96_16530 [Flavobacteriales bacterium]|nr:hypothetical protein [Flavobacteriales bacterium]
MHAAPHHPWVLAFLFALSATGVPAQSFLLGDTRGLLDLAEREQVERELEEATSEQEVEAILRAALIGVDHGQVTYLMKGAEDRWRERVFSVGQGRSAPALTATLSSRGLDEPVRTLTGLRALFHDTLVVLDTLQVQLELDPPLPVEGFLLYWAASDTEPLRTGRVSGNGEALVLHRGSFPGLAGNEVELYLQHRVRPDETLGFCRLRFLDGDEREALREVWCAEQERVPEADQEQDARFLHDLVEAWYGRCHAPRSTGLTCP